MRGARIRLDQALVETGLCPSRQQAKRAILAGKVIVAGKQSCKPADLIPLGLPLKLTEPERFVSRGGYKLEHALRHFELDVAGKTAIDLGASTGGFTDCLLQAGAAKVYAIDVGQGQLAGKLRTDPRVVLMEKTNARHLTKAQFRQPFETVAFITIDCSFISLRKILPSAIRLLRVYGNIVALVKPQFEAGRAAAVQGRGVISDPEIHHSILADMEGFVGKKLNMKWRGAVESPLSGRAGNKEFLVCFEKK